MGMVLTYLIIGAIISVGTILLRYYLSERKKQPRNDKSKSYGSTDNHYRWYVIDLGEQKEFRIQSKKRTIQ